MEACWEAARPPSSSALSPTQDHAQSTGRERFPARDAEDVLLDTVVCLQARDHLKFKPAVDLFPTDAHHQLPRYFTMTTDAFTLYWHREELPYLNSPWTFIAKAKVLNKIIADKVVAMMVIPGWRRHRCTLSGSAFVREALSYLSPSSLMPTDTSDLNPAGTHASAS